MTDHPAAVEAYPLSWPVGRPRTKIRRRAAFHNIAGGADEYRQRRPVTLYVGLTRLREELRLVGATNVVVSTNVPSRRDGLPYSGTREPDDPGVAVYFHLKTGVHCLACDKWDKVADNLVAVAKHVQAVRGQARWGVGDLAQAFAGHRALPPVGAPRPWWEALGFSKPPDEAESAQRKYKALISQYHPDRGGSHDRAAELNAAWQEAMRYYGETRSAS